MVVGVTMGAGLLLPPLPPPLPLKKIGVETEGAGVGGVMAIGAVVLVVVATWCSTKIL